MACSMTRWRPGSGEPPSRSIRPRGTSAIVSRGPVADVADAAGPAAAYVGRPYAGDRAIAGARGRGACRRDGPGRPRGARPASRAPSLTASCPSVSTTCASSGAARSPDGSGAGVLSTGYTLLVRRPVGVVGASRRGTSPFIMAIWKLGPALAAGTVSSPAPRPCRRLRLAEIAAGRGCCRCPQRSPRRRCIGSAPVEHPGCDASITGSSRARAGGDAAAAPSTSGCTSSSAARHRRWCSQTPTSPR